MLQKVDPRDICLAIPVHTGRIDVLTVNGVCNIIGTGRLANQPMFQYGGSNIGAVRASIAHEFLNRTACQWLMMLDDDVGFNVADWDVLWEDVAGEKAVCAEYLQKIDGQRVVAHFGLGFARIHRDVFLQMTELSTDDGQPWVRQGYYSGRLMWDFFPQGVASDGSYRQEDHGFWQLVRLTGLGVRVERRAHLTHNGRSSWRYDAGELASDDDGAQ